MSFEEFITWLGFSNKITFWGLIAFAASIGIEVIPKIKWNPWSSLIRWIGEKFNEKIDKKVGALELSMNEKISELDKKMDNKIDSLSSEMNAKVDDLGGKVDKLQTDLTDYVTEFNTKNLQDIRRDILEFCNACMNNRKHTKEQFDFVIRQCDDYEIYINTNHVKNGVIEAAIKEIHRLYDKCIQEHSFLQEGEDDQHTGGVA